MDSAPTLQRSRGLKMLIQWRGRSHGKSLILTGSNATAGPIPVYGREGDRTRKGLYSDSVCGGSDKENLMCLLWGETNYKVGEETVAASQAQGSKSTLKPSPSSFSSTSVCSDGFTFLKRDGRFRIWTSLRNCSPMGFCRGQTGRHQSFLSSYPHTAQGQLACTSEAEALGLDPVACILRNFRPGISQVPGHWGNL